MKSAVKKNLMTVRPMDKFTFKYESDKANLIKEFEVKEGASTEEVIQAFSHFLVLCGQAYDDDSVN